MVWTRAVLFLSGLYWQFTWRFAAPILLAGILTASVVFELTSSPTYSVWNKDTVTFLLIKRTSFLALITIIIWGNNNLVWKRQYSRVIHLTESRWPNEYDQTMTTTNLNNWTWQILKPTNLMKPTNLNLTSGVLLTSVPDVFFVGEWSDGASKAGQVFQPVRACDVCRCHKFQST